MDNLQIKITPLGEAQSLKTRAYEALKSAYHSEDVRDWYDEYLDGLLTPAFDRDIDAAWKEAHDK